MYDRTTVRPYKVLLLTCVVNCTAGTPTPRLCSVVQWSVHWAPSRTTRVRVLAGARRIALLLVAACGLLSHRKRLVCGLCTETDRFDKKEVKIVFLNCRKAQNSFCRRLDVGLPAKRNTENYDQLVIIISLICINTN